MVSGVPVPTDQLFALKRSLDSASTVFPHKQAGWRWYHTGFNRKVDQEPGRCKRTDGKKWRCSREAHRDSKYCERHMHRGRNSSRKCVELSITTSTTSPVMRINSNSVHDAIQTSALPHPASLYSLSSSRHQNSSTRQLFMESGSSYQTNKDYRFLQGMRDGKKALSPKVSKTVKSQHESYLTSEIASSDYSQTLNDHGKLEDQRRQDRDLKQHCFIFGNDFKPAKAIKLDRDEENQKTFHQFFSERPLNTKGHWLDNGNSKSNHASLSNTQLSTSTPLSTLELFQPRLHWY